MAKKVWLTETLPGSSLLDGHITGSTEKARFPTYHVHCPVASGLGGTQLALSRIPPLENLFPAASRTVRSYHSAWYMSLVTGVSPFVTEDSNSWSSWPTARFLSESCLDFKKIVSLKIYGQVFCSWFRYTAIQWQKLTIDYKSSFCIG